MRDLGRSAAAKCGQCACRHRACCSDFGLAAAGSARNVGPRRNDLADTGCRVERTHDLLIRCPEPVNPAIFEELAGKLAALPCRTDIQIETPTGAFALQEWLRRRGEGTGCRILLKTDHGPILTTDPWRSVQPAKREIS